MRPVIVVEIKVGTDPFVRRPDISLRSDIHVLVLYGAPQSLRENIVHASASAIHADSHIFSLEDSRILPVRKLHALIAVVNLRLGEGEGAVECGDAEVCFH